MTLMKYSLGSRLFVFFGLALTTVASLSAQSIGFERARAKLMLKQVSDEIEDKFYDPNLQGLEWKELTAQAEQRIEKTDSIGDMLTAIFVLVDHLKDSHTIFIPPGRAARTLYGFEAKAFGDEIRIYEIEEDGAAASAGLQLGDRILAINGYATDRDNIDLMMLYFRVLRPVARMEISYSRGNERPRTILVEAEIKQGKRQMDLASGQDVYQLIRELESDRETFHYRNYGDGIAYLQLPYFTPNKRFVKNLVKEIDSAKAIVVDLRGNPGGAVTGLEYLCGFFEAEPAVIAEMAGRKKNEPIRSKPQSPKLAVPLFILVDSQSASAAEVFARHFQRTGRGVVIGDHSSGRVTVSQFRRFEVGMEIVAFYGVSVAVARLVFPDGEELEKRGVTPDHLCLPTAEDLREERDPCRGKALALARASLGLPEEGEEGQTQEDRAKTQ